MGLEGDSSALKSALDGGAQCGDRHLQRASPVVGGAPGVHDARRGLLAAQKALELGPRELSATIDVTEFRRGTAMSTESREESILSMRIPAFTRPLTRGSVG